jgi:hypothetical protein
MTRADRTALRETHWQQIQELNRRKGKDYAGESDALSNFKRTADLTGLTPYQVWASSRTSISTPSTRLSATPARSRVSRLKGASMT